MLQIMEGHRGAAGWATVWDASRDERGREASYLWLGGAEVSQASG